MSTIRLATMDDLTAIRNCVAAAYGHYVERIGRRPAPIDADYAEPIRRDEVFVLTAPEVAGVLVLIERDSVLLLENVAIHPEFQGHGFGRRLMDFAETHALERGKTRIDLYTNERMTENLRLYPRLGYSEVERRTENGFNRVYFTKRLAGSER